MKDGTATRNWHVYTAGTCHPETKAAGFAAAVFDGNGCELMHAEGGLTAGRGSITDYDVELIAFQAADTLMKMIRDARYAIVHPASDLLRHNFFYLYHQEEGIRKIGDPDGNRFVEYFDDGLMFASWESETGDHQARIDACRKRAEDKAIAEERQAIGA